MSGRRLRPPWIFIPFLIASVIADNKVQILPPPTPGAAQVSVTTMSSTGFMNITFLEEAPVPFSILSIPETGKEKPTVHYLLGQPETMGLEVYDNGSYWIVNVTIKQDFDDTNQHLVIFNVNMKGKDPERVYAQVLNINDHAPILTTDSTICNVPENWNGTTDCVITARDADGDYNNLFINIEESGVPSSIFNLTKMTKLDSDRILNLNVLQNLDYETKNTYSLDLYGKDENFTANLSIVVKVQDMPDEPPVWYIANPVFSISEESPFNVTLLAVDGDAKAKRPIRYRLDSTGTDGYFHINSTTGVLHVDPIDRDQPGNDQFEFNVTAYELNPPASEPLNETRIKLIFMIEDIDDNLPKFNTHAINITVPEGSTTLKIDEISVNDPDMANNGTFDVTLKSDDKVTDFTKAFSVIPSQGYQSAEFSLLVLNSSLLDFENPSWRHIQMTLLATEVADANHKDQLSISINLQNENDESPKFNQTVYHASVYENVTSGYLLTTLTAHDNDGLKGDGNGGIDTITYTTTSTTGIVINETNGEVRVASDNSFDYELQKVFLATVIAKDLVGHADYAQLNISVKDVDDVAPTLEMPSTRVVVMENSSISKTVPGSDIRATDPDTEAELVFSIDWPTSFATSNGIRVSESKYINTFNISLNATCDTTACANLTVAKTLHWDYFDTIILNITVRDLKTIPSLPDKAEQSATLTVAIHDVNNNPPDISPISGLHVPENSNAGQTIANVVASDNDFNPKLEYFLTEIGDTPPDWVKINESTGVLYVGPTTIDCETHHELHYTVTVFDGVHNSTEEIDIAVIDLNDEAPVFSTEAMNKSIMENSKDNTRIIQMHATDGDYTAQYNKVSYIMDALYPNFYFAIDLDDGWITVSLKPNHTLDRELQETYEIHIDARDNYNASSDYNSHSTQKFVALTLLDENDEYPKFNDEPQDCQGGREYVETTGKGDSLFSITAIDKDKESTPYSEIKFTIEEILPLDGSKDPNDGTQEKLFSIKTSFVQPNYNGEVTAGRSLEGYFGKYNITVQASDMDPDSPKKTSQTYTICIKDINDHSPKIVFPNPGSQFLIYDTQSLHETISLDDNTDLPLFYATDADGGRNGEVTFDILGSEYTSRYFTVVDGDKKNTGKLILKKKLDINTMQYRNFSMEIIAIDNGEQPLNETTNVIIKVLTNESHEPYFEKKESNQTFPENMKAHFNFSEAYDVDNVYKPINQMQMIYYFIVSGNKSLFSIDNKNEAMVTVQELDYETKTNHTIYIKASNDPTETTTPPSDLQGKDILKIIIYVKDVNDNPPRFLKRLYVGGVATEDTIGSQVFPVTAMDPDTNDHIKYSLMWDTMEANGSFHNFINSSFKLNPKSGILTLQFQPQADMTGIFTFKMKATDNLGHNDTVPAMVFPVTNANREKFKFGNPTDYVKAHENVVTEILSNNLNYTCNIKYIIPDANSNGIQTNNTVVNTLFMDDKAHMPVDASKIQESINIFQVRTKIKNDFIGYGLDWSDFNGNEPAPSISNEAFHQTILIGVSAVLATLVFLLLAAFFFKTRSLNRRLEALSQTKFGSMDSGLNRVNMNVPNTNQHALEGSNPVWNEEIQNDDNISQGSDDSDLVGIEDNPEFKAQDDADSEARSPSEINEHHSGSNFSFGPAKPGTPTTEL